MSNIKFPVSIYSLRTVEEGASVPLFLIGDGDGNHLCVVEDEEIADEIVRLLNKDYYDTEHSIGAALAHRTMDRVK